MKTKIIVVVGPTASGKTALAVKICEAFNGAVISADSMQIYKGMSIATAKPSELEMRGIRHYLIDFLEPDESYSVGRFLSDAKAAVKEIISQNKVPVICGGTGLYVDSLINGITFVDDSVNPEIRSELKMLYEKEGVDYLLKILESFDPDSAQRLSFEKNPKRVMRAIEIYKSTGVTLTEQNKNSKLLESGFDALYIGLKSCDRQFLYDRINRRVDKMVDDGLLEEARAVLGSNLSPTSSGAIGYRQLVPYFKGESTLDECIERLKTDTRHYAKRQLTWFNRNKDIHWLNIDELTSRDSQFNNIENLIRGFLNG